MSDITSLNALGQAFGNGGFAHARLANQHWVVLGASAKDLDDTVDFVLASHHRIELALTSQLREVATEFIQRWCLGRSFGTTSTAAGTHLGGFAEHANHLGTHLGKVNAEIFQNACSDAFTFANLSPGGGALYRCSYARVGEPLRGKLKNTFGPRREGNFNGHKPRSAADDLFDFNASVLEVDTH